MMDKSQGWPAPNPYAPPPIELEQEEVLREATGWSRRFDRFFRIVPVASLGIALLCSPAALPGGSVVSRGLLPEMLVLLVLSVVTYAVGIISRQSLGADNSAELSPVYRWLAIAAILALVATLSVLEYSPQTWRFPILRWFFTDV